jgi:hypothetical protein
LSPERVTIRNSRDLLFVHPDVNVQPRNSSGILRMLRHLLFNASRHGRCAEIAGWSNAVAALGFATGAMVLLNSWILAAGVFVLAFVLLRLALANRLSLGVAACCGTIAVAGAGGGVAWLFAHVLESYPSAPWVALVVGGIAAGALPAWAYGRLLGLRESGVRDSLTHPESVPSSSPRG